MFHEAGETCRCNPTVIPVERPDGSIGWVYAHNEPGEEESVDRTLKIFEAMETVRNKTDG